MHDKLTPLRLVLLVGLAGYFAFLLSQPQEAPLVVQENSPAPAASAKPAPTPANCQGQIEQVTQSSYEIRLKIGGAAERILVYTDQGNITTSTVEAGSASEYRIRTPGPATAVQLDDCPVLNLR